ncbi:hypothetical protein [Rhodoplanes serenus]|uniref:hypothetical protein n=1 Tax=Rhodoplanes serenus TaxID=200615 RepID=UPI000DABDC71|nr:hypothetical protein [Rhodoplanes serenus]RAI34527.1 hypothetical protein CH340_08855 [Rhodoplanes serenus]
MSDLFPVAGMKIYIGGAKASQAADFTAADFASEVWTEIDGWETVGAFGDTAALISTDLVNRGRTVKQKGTSNAGQMQNQFAKIDDDPGQIALIAAAAGGNKSNYAFRIDGNDQVGGGQPSKRYFIALVMGASEQGGSANTIRMLQATLEINSNIVRVART